MGAAALGSCGGLPRPPLSSQYGREIHHQAERVTVAGLRWRFAVAMTLVAAGFMLVVAVFAALT